MSQPSYSGPHRPADASDDPADEAPHRVASSELLRGRRKLFIEHGESTYVLLLTRNGRLILNK